MGSKHRDRIRQALLRGDGRQKETNKSIHLGSHKPLSQNRPLTDVCEPSFLTFVDLGRSTQRVGVHYTRAHVQWLILNRVSGSEACPGVRDWDKSYPLQVNKRRFVD